MIINTYYVLLSRARNKMGIWFKDDATRRHVTEFLGLEVYSPADTAFQEADDTTTVHENKHSGMVVGNNSNKSFHRPDCQYAPLNPSKRVEFASIADAQNAGYKPCRTCNPLI